MATLAEKKAFIQRVWDTIAGMDIKGFFPSVLIAQAALESNWGQSLLAKKYNNYFGIKAGSGWKGRSVNMKTGEVLNGKNVTINSNFRVYNSLEDSILDRNRLLSTPRYASVKQASTPMDQAQAIKNSGYATATNYVNSLMATININLLSRYDELKKK